MFALLFLQKPGLKDTITLSISLSISYRCHKIGTSWLNTPHNDLFVCPTGYQFQTFFHSVQTPFFSKINRSNCAGMIIQYSYILVIHALTVILIDMGQTISTTTCQPKLARFFILCTTKVDVRSRRIPLKLTCHRRIIEADYLTIMSLNTLYLLVCRIKR